MLVLDVIRRLPTGENTSVIKKTYLMAQFLQCPNEYFEFDHVMWEVVFIFHPYGVADARTREIRFKATTGGILGLYNCYIQFNIPEYHEWNHCVELAVPIAQSNHEMETTYGAQRTIQRTVQRAVPKVNWGRDGF